MRYQSILTINETQCAIGLIKKIFSEYLTKALNLTRVTAPLFLELKSGLNDTLNGEKAVSVSFKNHPEAIEIIHSLAKWKRHNLKLLDFPLFSGLYGNTNAIRREETLDNTHSFYVDQWDWEINIPKQNRTFNYLKFIVNDIYRQILRMEYRLKSEYPALSIKLPETLVFIDSQELEDLYPHLNAKAREDAFAKKHAAFFISRIGYPLKSKRPHSGRAFDYDDWTLNGDLIFYHPVLDQALEISSMGIRVDKEALLAQSQKSVQQLKSLSPYHRAIMEASLPYSIGGGIGQSRLCMFLLEKAHIGEVQSSFWSQAEREKAQKAGIFLL